MLGLDSIRVSKRARGNLNQNVTHLSVNNIAAALQMTMPNELSWMWKKKKHVNFNL